MTSGIYIAEFNRETIKLIIELVYKLDDNILAKF